MKYRPDVDGLRAVAVVPVLLFHAKLGCPGGYVGVDVFFVISGYLITGLILRDLRSDRFHLLTFWERRVRRIIPALVAVSIAVLVAGWFLLLPEDFDNLGQSVVAQCLMISNVFFWRTSGYFAAPAETKPLLHFWSLAVEEQFYVFLPLLLVLLSRFRHRVVFISLTLLAVASFVLGVYGTIFHRSATYYFLPTRAWELLLGCLLASVSVRSVGLRPLVREMLSAGGLVSIIAASMVYDGSTAFPGVAALLPCMGAAVVILANGGKLTRTGKVLAAKPCVFVGMISYSLYLWHWPMLVYAQYWVLDELEWPYRAALLALSGVAAVVCWAVVETPFRKRWVFGQRSAILGFGVCSVFALLVCGVVIVHLQGVKSRFSLQTLAYADKIALDGFDKVSVDAAGKPQFYSVGDAAYPVKALVWGDSHAMAIMPALAQLSQEYRIRFVGATNHATVPLLSVADSQFGFAVKGLPDGESVVEYVRNEKIGNVLIVANWDYYKFGLTDAGCSELKQRLSVTVGALRNAGAKVWIMQTVPGTRVDAPRGLARASFLGLNPVQVCKGISTYLEAKYRERATINEMRDAGAVVLDPIDLFKQGNGLFRAEINGKPLYRDDNHLNTYGAVQLIPLFRPMCRMATAIGGDVHARGI